MLFWLFAVIVPVLTIFGLPKFIERYSGKKARSNNLLYLAGSLYAVSWFLPSFLINGIDTSFTTHFVGGGLYCGFVWAHIIRQIEWRLAPTIQLVSLLALVSMLGAVNELVELFLVEVGSIRINSLDVWWDILANTLGALAFWLIYRLYILISKDS